VSGSLTVKLVRVDQSRSEQMVADRNQVDVLKKGAGVREAAEGGGDGAQVVDLEALIDQKVAEAVAAAVAAVWEQVTSNTAAVEDLRLVVSGVGAVLRDCVV